MNHNHIVLITSAIHTNYGIFTPQQRIQQTLETAQSARDRIPNATIILIDNSKVDVQNDESAEFEALLDTVDYYIDNSDDPDIQHFHNNVSNYDIGKNSMECLGMFKTLNYIAGDAELMSQIKSASRIFKLSGRYTLTEEFDIAKFDNADTADKYVFKIRQPSWIPQKDTQVDHLLQTRLWSFTPGLFEETVSLFDTIIKNMFATFNQQKYIDVEHSMAKFIPKDKLVEVETIGLLGNIAPNGMLIVD
jgi:hypothetical protein